MNELHWLKEDLKSIKNMCDISLILIEGNHIDILPTELENLYLVAQHLIDTHCIKEE